jgi:hypothetical protein
MLRQGQYALGRGIGDSMVGANWGVSGHDVVLGLVGAPSLFDNPHASMFRGRSEVSGEAGRVVTCRSTEHTQSLCRERELAA